MLTLPRINGNDAWRAHWAACAARPCPPLPTDARPGSAAKLHILIERWAAGFALWHPADVRIRVPSWLRAGGRFGQNARTKSARRGMTAGKGD